MVSLFDPIEDVLYEIYLGTVGRHIDKLHILSTYHEVLNKRCLVKLSIIHDDGHSALKCDI